MFTLKDWIDQRNARQAAPPMEPTMTNAVAGEMPSVEVMLMAVERIAKEPVPIGTLHGFNVFASRDVAEGVVKVVDPKTGQEMLRFTLDHKYVEGTKIQEAAREALGK